MSTDDNKETARRIYDMFARGNPDEFGRYMSNDIVDHDASPGQRPGLEGIRELIQEYRNAFSDLRHEIHDQIAEGDKVVTRVTIHGKHTGEFQGIPPTGKDVSFKVVDILRLSGGKAVERWGIEDNVGFLTQLGAMPESGQPGRRAA